MKGSKGSVTPEIAAAAVAEHGSQNKAALALGIARSTLQHHLQNFGNAKPEYDAPSLESSGLCADDLIARNKAIFHRRHKAEQSRMWMEFKVRTKGPFALAFVGDPHMDSNGCNWPLLERDIGIIRDTEAMFGVGMGDYTNNWSFRLQQLWQHEENTSADAWKLAEWFFGQKKANGQSIWWLLLKGNHDQWSGKSSNGDVLDWLQRGSAALEDWQARFVAVSGKCRVPIWAAHDFKGSSIWNPLHGPMRKGQLNSQADIYVCGDKHNWALMELESQEQPGRISWAARARGYKYLDHYADMLGFGSQQYGATITAVIDPATEGPMRARCFPDLEEARDFLKFKRRHL